MHAKGTADAGSAVLRKDVAEEPDASTRADTMSTRHAAATAYGNNDLTFLLGSVSAILESISVYPSRARLQHRTGDGIIYVRRFSGMPTISGRTDCL